MADKPDTAKLVQFGDGSHWTAGEKAAVDWRLAVLRGVLWIASGLLVIAGARNALFAWSFGTTPLECGLYAAVAISFAALAGLMPTAIAAAESEDNPATVRVARHVWAASTLATTAIAVCLAAHVGVAPVVSVADTPKPESGLKNSSGLPNLDAIYADLAAAERSKYWRRTDHCQYATSGAQDDFCIRYAQLRNRLDQAQEAAANSFDAPTAPAPILASVEPPSDSPLRMALRIAFAVLSTLGAACGVDLAMRGSTAIRTGRTSFQRPIDAPPLTDEEDDENEFWAFFLRQIEWGSGYETPASVLYARYGQLCSMNGKTALSVSQFGKQMAAELTARGGCVRHSNGSVYVGCRVPPDNREPPRWAPSK